MCVIPAKEWRVIIRSWEPFAMYRYIRHSPGTVCAKAPPKPSPMSPYDFVASDAGAILRSRDGKGSRIHRLIHSLASLAFQGGMFSLSKPTEPFPLPQIPIIDIPEPFEVPHPFLRSSILDGHRKSPSRCKKPGDMAD